MAGPNAARITDPHACPAVEPGPVPHVGGPIQTGSGDVFIEHLRAARAERDHALCLAGGLDPIAQGAATVVINGLPAVRTGCMTQHGGVVTGLAKTVVIGGPTVTILKIRKGKGGVASGAAKGTKVPLSGAKADGPAESAGGGGPVLPLTQCHAEEFLVEVTQPGSGVIQRHLPPRSTEIVNRGHRIDVLVSVNACPARAVLLMKDPACSVHASALLELRTKEGAVLTATNSSLNFEVDYPATGLDHLPIRQWFPSPANSPYNIYELIPNTCSAEHGIDPVVIRAFPKITAEFKFGIEFSISQSKEYDSRELTDKRLFSFEPFSGSIQYGSSKKDYKVKIEQDLKKGVDIFEKKVAPLLRDVLGLCARYAGASANAGLGFDLKYSYSNKEAPENAYGLEIEEEFAIEASATLGVSANILPALLSLFPGSGFIQLVKKLARSRKLSKEEDLVQFILAATGNLEGSLNFGRGSADSGGSVTGCLKFEVSLVAKLEFKKGFWIVKSKINAVAEGKASASCSLRMGAREGGDGPGCAFFKADFEGLELSFVAYVSGNVEIGGSDKESGIGGGAEADERWTLKDTSLKLFGPVTTGEVELFQL